MRRPTCAALAAALSFLVHAGSAQADRIQLADDPDLAVSFGVGGFIGKKEDKLEFIRIQPPYLRLEAALFRSPDRRWLNRLNVFGSLSLEFVDISYRTDPELVTIEDAEGNEYEVKEDGLERADLSSDWNLSGGGGMRLTLFEDRSVFSSKDKVGLHIDAFGEVAGSFRKMKATPNILLVNWQGFGLDVSDLAKEHADLSMRWRFLHYGFTAGVPIDKWKDVGSLRLTPFVTFGYMHFRAAVRMDVDEDIQQQLDKLGVDPDAIPRKHGVDVDSYSGSVGARLEIDRFSALETSGSFIATRSGTKVFWATLSYSMRFNYPW